MKDACWLLPKHPPVFCVLGRFGDLILLLPAFREVHRRTGYKPIVIVSHKYASVLEGVSYVTPDIVKEDWYDGMPAARRMAERKYSYCLVPAWWHDPDTAYDIASEMHVKGTMVLQSHGKQWGVNCEDNPDFGTSMWRRAGFTRHEMLNLPLIFDKRNPSREAELVKRYVRGGRPLILINFNGISSPFGYVPEMQRLIQPYRLTCEVLDLGQIQAQRIYDLLGLYDIATGLITIDSATCHLAPASKVPTLWFTVPGWGKSVPRGNVALHVQYDETPKRLPEIQDLLEKWKAA